MWVSENEAQHFYANSQEKGSHLCTDEILL
jgi:hypothetical protein